MQTNRPVAANDEAAKMNGEFDSHSTGGIGTETRRDGRDTHSGGTGGTSNPYALAENTFLSPEKNVFHTGTGENASPQSPQGDLLPEHLAELESSAISADVARSQGVYSALICEDLPEWARWIVDKHGEATLPAIVYPMLELDGAPTGQIKPRAGSVVGADGDTLKYLSPSDFGDAPHAPRLPVLIEPSGPAQGVLIVEGVKQALAAVECAPAGWWVLRICGIMGWSRNGVAPSSLKVVRDLPVVIVPDADATRNLAVYDGAKALGAVCEAKGAASVRYARVPGTGTAGLDDVLAGEDEGDRAAFLHRLVKNAKAKPADRVPPSRGSGWGTPPSSSVNPGGAGDPAHRSADRRAMIDVSADRLEVINKCLKALRAKFDGTELFGHGWAFGQLVDGEDGPMLLTVGDGELAHLVARAARTFSVDAKGSRREAWPDKNCMAAISSAHRDFTKVDGVSRVPLVREDGSIAATNGYDERTRHIIALSPELDGLSVPSNPSDHEVAAARDLLLDDLLGDFLLPTAADRAHALAALLTPLVRPLVPTSPFFVVDGLQMGVGKGLLLSVIAVITTGQRPSLEQLPGTEDEVRKRITASLHAGSTMLMWDEVHELGSLALNSLVTAERWSDRKLGKTERIEMPNKASLYFAGNNVQITGDAVRRALPVRLSTDAPSPETRSGFRHELPGWAEENRRELLEAALTLIRAWFARGCPEAPLEFSFGSFERWQDVIGGVLAVAKVPDFLVGVREARTVNDFATQYWVAHLEWLEHTFGVGTPFASRAVMQLAGGDGSEMPPGMDSSASARELGQKYAGVVGRWWGDLRLVRAGSVHGNSSAWQLECNGGSVGGAAPTPGPVDPEPTSPFSLPEVGASPGMAPVIADLPSEVA